MVSPAVKWTLRIAAIPAAIVAYIAVAGTTGFCPGCKSIVDGVLGRCTAAEQAPAVGAARPDSITALTAFTLEGKPANLSSYIGKPIIIELWATWCPPCREQRQIIHDMGKDISRRASVISMSVDRDPATVRTFLEDHPMSPVELMATPETQRALKVEAVPVLVFVDKTGKIREVITGMQTAEQLTQRLDALGG